MKNKFKLKIGSQVLDNLISYPVSIKYRNLSGARDEYVIPLFKTVISKPFSPHQLVELEWKNDDSTIERNYGILVSDHIEKMGVRDLYNHTLTVLEYSHYLTLFVSPDITHTNRRGKRVSILDIYRRVMLINRREYRDMRPFELDEYTAAKLDSKIAPEFTFTRMTLYEIIETLFSYCEVNPKFKDFGMLSHFSPLEIEAGNRTNPFVSMEESYDPQTLNTTLVSDVHNMEVSQVLVEPSFGYKTVRSEDGFEISNDNLMIETSRDIVSVEDIRIELDVYGIGAGTPIQKIPRDIIPSHLLYNSIVVDEAGVVLGENDVKERFVVEKSVYDVLKESETPDGKGAKIYFETGKRHIRGLSQRAPTKISWFPKRQAIANIIIDSFTGQEGELTTKQIFWDEFQPQFEHYRERAFRYIKGIPDDREMTPTERANFDLFALFTTAADVNTDNVNPSGASLKNLMNLSVQVHYKPYLDTKIYTHRERSSREGTSISTQTHNQITNTTSNLLYGELLDRISRANSGFDKTIRYMIKDSDSILDIGTRAGDYIITGGLLNINKTYIDATYSFDEFYAKINHYIGLREQWRQFEIPVDNFLDQQATSSVFAKITNEPEAKGMIDVRKYLDNDIVDNLTFSLKREGIETDYILPALSFPFNNVIVSEARTETNNMVGSSSEERLDSGGKVVKNKRFNTPEAIDYGEILNVAFNTTFLADESYNIEEKHGLPRIVDWRPPYRDIELTKPYNSPISKDARERIIWSLQIHHVDETGEWYINPSFVALNGLVGGLGLNNAAVKVAMLDFKPHNTMSLPLNSPHIFNVKDAEFNIFNDSYIELPRGSNTSQKSSDSVALILESDNHYEILLWQDTPLQPGETSPQAYIGFDDIYRKEDRIYTYAWELTDGPIWRPDYVVDSAAKLPSPFAPNLTAQVSYSEWQESMPHTADKNYITSEKLLSAPAGTKAIVTGYDLIEEGSSIYDSTKEDYWRPLEEYAGQPNYTRRFAADLPAPSGRYETALIRRTDYKEEYFAHMPNKILGEPSELHDNLLMGFDTIMTGHTLRETTREKFNEGYEWIWNRDDSLTAPFTYEVQTNDDRPTINRAGETVRVSNLNWSQRSQYHEAEVGYIVPQQKDLPTDTTTPGRQATVSGFNLVPATYADYADGRYLGWSTSDALEGPFDQETNSFADLATPTRRLETARVHGLTWNISTSNNRADFFRNSIADIRDIPFTSVGETPRLAVATQHDLVAANYSDYIAQRTYEWVEADFTHTPDYTVKYRQDLPAATHYKTARVYRNNLTPIPESDQLPYMLGYIAATEEELKVNTSPGTYTFGIITGWRLKRIDTAMTPEFVMTIGAGGGFTEDQVWYEMYLNHYQYFEQLDMLDGFACFGVDTGEGIIKYTTEYAGGNIDNEYYLLGRITDERFAAEMRDGLHNISIQVPSGASHHDVWTTLREEHATYFANLRLHANGGGVIEARMPAGDGDLYYSLEPVINTPSTPNTYESVKSYEYYVADNMWPTDSLRVDINAPSHANMNEILYAFQEQASQRFSEADRFEDAGGIIRVRIGVSGGGNEYYKVEVVPGYTQPQYFISNVNPATYRSLLYVPSSRKSIISLSNTDAATIWMALRSREPYTFSNLADFAAALGVIKVEDNQATERFYEVVPIPDAQPNLRYFRIDKQVSDYYETDTRWTGLRIEFEVPESGSQDDVWFTLQTQELQHFNDLSRFAASGGRIKVDTGFGNRYYRMEAVDGEAQLRYFVAASQTIEYYVSRVLR